MNIAGLQKLTLLDFPGRTACTLFTPGCNLRCPFCQNGSLVEPSPGASLLPQEELLDFLRKRQGLLDGVCLTGGEPLLQADLTAFCRQVKAMGFALKLDTNGTQPQQLSSLLEEGLLDYVAMDVKNAPEYYARTVGTASFDLAPVAQSARLLMQGRTAFEFRTTVVAGLHDVQRVTQMAQWLAGPQNWYLQAFRDSEHVLEPGLQGLDAEQMQALRQQMLPFVPHTALRGL